MRRRIWIRACMPMLQVRQKSFRQMWMRSCWRRSFPIRRWQRFAADALRQIDEKRYDAELIELGVTPIFKLGIAFSGKRVKIKTI